MRSARQIEAFVAQTVKTAENLRRAEALVASSQNRPQALKVARREARQALWAHITKASKLIDLAAL